MLKRNLLLQTLCHSRSSGIPENPLLQQTTSSVFVVTNVANKEGNSFYYLLCRNSVKNTLGYFLKFSPFRITSFAIARNLSLMKGRAGYSQMESTCLCNMKRQNNRKKLLHVMTVEFPAQLPPIFLTVCLILIHITTL